MDEVRLIDANALSIRIKEWIHEQETVDSNISSFIITTTLNDVLDIIENCPSIDSNGFSPHIMAWIDAKKRLPPQVVSMTDSVFEVFVLDKTGHVDIAYRWKNLWVKSRGISKFIPDNTITHWMPIIPPKKGEQT